MDISTAKYTAGITGDNINVKVITGDSKELWIPLDNSNTDYVAVLEWVADGNTIAAAE
jgi:hypothetical protein